MDSNVTFDRDDLLDLDLGAVAPKENIPLVAGKYLFASEGADLVDGEDKDGNPRLVMVFKNRVLKVKALDKKVDNPDQFVGQVIAERFYAPTTDNVGYLRKYIDNVMGAEVSQGTNLRQLMEALGSGEVRFIGRVETREWQNRKVANLSTNSKDFVGFDQLSEEDAGASA